MKKLLFLALALTAMVCCWQSNAVADSPVTDGLMLHLEAGAITGLADGEAITGWPATVGNDATIAGTDPNYVADVGNGMPGVNFANGIDDSDDGVIQFDRMTNIRTVFWVLREDANADNDGFLLGDSGAYHFHRGTDNGTLWHGTHTAGNIKNGTTAINGTAVDGIAVDPPTDLSIISVVTTGNVTARSFSNDRDIASRGWDGQLAELLIFDRPLSAIEENEVGSYLANKYGLTTSYTDKVFVVNQSPANGAQRVDQTPTLSWDSALAQGTPTYKVYLSADPNNVDPTAPDFIDAPIATTQDTTVTPAEPLAPATTYYWRVEVSDDADTTTGDILTFTTGGDIVDITPADGTISVATDVTVTWAPETEGATYINGYDVFFGETLPGTPTATVTENQWTTPALADNTTYQCKIVSLHDGTPVLDGMVSFTTGGLAGYWKFDGDLTDEIGDNDGTRTTPQFADGVIDDGQAVDFLDDFAQDPVTIPIVDVVGGTNVSWTITFWEYSYPGGTDWESICGNGPDGNGWNTFEMGRLDTKRYVWGLAGGGYKYSPNDDSFLREGWHFHVMSYNQATNTAHWYINGTIIQTYGGANMNLDPTMYVGNVKGLSQPFLGKVDDLKVYTRPTSLAQAIAEYVNGAGGAPILPDPVTGTQNVAWDLTLGWSASDDATAHTLDIGKLSDLSDAQSFTLAAEARTFDVAAEMGINLDLDTEYFWRVTSTLPDGDVAGATWLFRVRELTTDLNGDLAVNGVDLSQMAGKWLDDTSEFPPSEYPIIDQQGWDVTGGDPNITDYDRYVAPGGAWGTSEFTVKTDPTPGDENYTPPTQTLLWTGTGTAGQQHIGGINFPEGVVDFSDFDKVGFWVYQRGTTGNFQLRAFDADGNNVRTETVYGMQSNNDQWYNYEWNVAEGVGEVHHFDIWMAATTWNQEFGNFYLKKDDITVKLCLKENQTNIEDLNLDCIIDLIDLAIMAQDWMLDASN